MEATISCFLSDSTSNREFYIIYIFSDVNNSRRFFQIKNVIYVCIKRHVFILYATWLFVTFQLLQIAILLLYQNYLNVFCIIKEFFDRQKKSVRLKLGKMLSFVRFFLSQRESFFLIFATSNTISNTFLS